MRAHGQARPASTLEALAAIAVPLDATFASERAMPPAVWLARRAGVPLRLVGLNDDETQLDAMREYLGDVAAEVPGCVVVDTVVAPDARLAATEPETFIAALPRDGATVCTAIPRVDGALVQVADRPVVVVGPRVVPLDLRTAPEIVAYIDDPAADSHVTSVASAWGAALALPWRVDLAEHGSDFRAGARLVLVAAPPPESARSVSDAIRDVVLDATCPVVLVPAA